MKNTILIFFAILCGSAQAQQEPIFSQFWNAKTYYNPATTGLNFKHLSTTIGRWQNVGVEGQPITQLLGYAINLKKLHGGLGFTYMHEEIGSSTFNKTKFNYAYHIRTKKEGFFTIGAAAGFNALKLDISMPETVETSGVGFTADFGIAYSSKKANFALSCTQINQGRVTNGYQESPHLVLMSDYIFGNEEGLQIKPQVFAMTDLNKITYDINAMVLWKQKVGMGVTFRSNEDLSFSVNWDIVKKFRVGYAYDMALGALSGTSKGSHTGFFGLVFREKKQ